MRRAILAMAALWAAPGWAQPAATIEATTGYRVRGLSWSGGRAAALGVLFVDLPAGLRAESLAATARGAARHGGADAAVDLTLGRRFALGALALDATAIGHLFPGGRGAQDYVEGAAALEGALGPVTATVSAAYAPRQAAIGGDNLHLRAAARVGVIGTPYTLRAQLGWSDGDARDPARAARLRPGGAYADWLIGVDRISGPLTLGIAYSDTDLGGAAAQPAFRRHAGAIVTVRAALSF